MATTKTSRKVPGARKPRGSRRPGAAEKGISAAVRASRKGGKADPRFAGVEALARVAGRALDEAVSAGERYAVAQLLPRVLDVLDAMQLTPESAGTGDDSLGEFLASLATPTLVHAA
ncbi:hypothetical protein GCM10010334_51160 [Streptomyces finlayi]|uniref:Uncharacterized protein n=1 Tax=Streptomyces finlayi TaxID=67296 RepID=A0A918X1E7_9ACTN|nr:hypothetical protein [Streptomyces finlayi]GHD03424.1 hypothetical protein GCM10010334_51160 [Streptomyces finlayi]